MIEFADVSKTYGNNYYKTIVFENISFQIDSGATVAITGKSGAGKSTLINLMCGIDIPNSGSIIIDGETISAYKSKKLSDFRLRKCGFVFQDYQLVSSLSVYDNMIFTAAARNEKVDRQWLDHVIEITGLAEKLKAFPGQLSGGEKQRVSIARAIMTRPSYLFADEPTGNLDNANTELIMNFLWKYAKDENCTFIYVTHDTDLCGNADKVLNVCDRNVHFIR